MSELARIESEPRGDGCLVRVKGEIDMSNAAEVASAIEAAVATDARELVLDLTETQYLDSAGIALLVRLGERLRSRRQNVRVISPEGSAVRAVLRLAGLSDLLPVSSSLDEVG